MSSFSKNRFKYALIVYVILILIFLLAADTIIMSSNRKTLLREGSDHARSELNVLSILLREQLLREDYSVAEQSVLQWGMEHDPVVELRIIAPNNFILSSYKREEGTENPSEFEQEISYGGRKLATVKMVKDMTPLYTRLKKLHNRMISHSIFLMFIMGVSLWFTMRKIAWLPLEREVDRRTELEEALRRSSDDLENKVVERTRDLVRTNIKLQDEINMRKKAEEELKAYHNKLEELVELRTDEVNKKMAETEQMNKGMVNLLEDLQSSYDQKNMMAAKLQEANRELESFSYSVSHDLRAPLRAINGFSNAVLEDYGESFDGDARRYLGLIKDNAVSMGQLIDDLLEFSRLGRKAMRCTTVDIKDVATEVFEELKHGDQESKVAIEIKALPYARGDRKMIKIILANLISNAVKYSSTKENPSIEIGGNKDGEQNVYYVKDNGVGFDMKYEGKLFGVFQRLHSAEVFQGTGVGLATVKRIIQRHNGTVWGEGKVDEGATFYFTLPGAGVMQDIKEG